MRNDPVTASLIFAAGKGSRMKDFEGNKALLPLVPGNSGFEGGSPILLHILDKLPPGPKALVVNHRKEDVIAATKSRSLTYFEQPVLNGTGGALLAARPFIESTHADFLIITMGDIPLVEASTYCRLVEGLRDSSMMVLGFQPEDKKQYGLIETDGNRVNRIIEWKY
ncbi:MAG: NTP transferase domain-containing protein, partial [Pseudomonadota bacterium]